MSEISSDIINQVILLKYILSEVSLTGDWLYYFCKLTTARVYVFSRPKIKAMDIFKVSIRYIVNFLTLFPKKKIIYHRQWNIRSIELWLYFKYCFSRKSRTNFNQISNAYRTRIYAPIAVRKYKNTQVFNQNNVMLKIILLLHLKEIMYATTV